MRRIHPLKRLFIAAVLVLLVASCSKGRTGPEGETPVPDQTPEELPLAVLSVIGGAAKHCDELSIQRDGSYVFTSCRGASVRGTLNPEVVDPMLEWADHYAPFELEVESAVGEASTRLMWHGLGEDAVDESKGQEVLDRVRSLPIDALRVVMKEHTALGRARAFLMTRLGFSASAISDVELEAVQFPDASLGCPEAGKMYAQVITQGYLFAFTVDGKAYEVHTNADGSSVVLCSAKSTGLSLTNYVDTRLSFSIAYPEGWQIDASAQESAVSFRPLDRASTGIEVFRLGGGFTNEDASRLLNEYLRQSQQDMPGAAPVGDEDDVIAIDAQGRQLVFQGTPPDGALASYLVAVLVGKTGTAYRLLLWAPIDEYVSLSSFYDRVVFSFRPFSESAPAPATGEAASESPPTTVATAIQPSPAARETASQPPPPTREITSQPTLPTAAAVETVTPIPTATVTPTAEPSRTTRFVGSFDGYVDAGNVADDRCSVRGRVVDANGSPVAGAVLRLSAFDWYVDHFTGGDGRYAFDFLDQELTWTVTPRNFPGDPVEATTKFGVVAEVNFTGRNR